MMQGVTIQMDPAEWRALLDLAKKGRPKGEEQEAMFRVLEKNAEVMALAGTITVKEPF